MYSMTQWGQNLIEVAFDSTANTMVFKLYSCEVAATEDVPRDHSSITTAKRWVGGVRKWQFLLIYSTIYADGRWEGGPKKAKNMLTQYLNGP